MPASAENPTWALPSAFVSHPISSSAPLPARPYTPRAVARDVPKVSLNKATSVVGRYRYHAVPPDGKQSRGSSDLLVPSLVFVPPLKGRLDTVYALSTSS